MAVILGATKSITKLSSFELVQANAGYGIVNPFLDFRSHVQIFDEDLLNRYTPPHTMITNAGERTWAIEFKVPEVINALRRESEQVLVARIAIPPAEGKRVPIFGIVTGNGPESGMALWRYLNEEVRLAYLAVGPFYGDVSYPRVLIESRPDMAVAMDFPDREDLLWQTIEAAVGNLCDRGATHIAIACHTSQYFGGRIREFLSGSPVEFVSAADVTFDYLQASGSNEVTILGVPVVADLGPFSGYCSLATLGVHPLDHRSAAHLQRAALLVKDADPKCASAALNRLQHVLRTSVHTPTVLVALTELSVLLAAYPHLREQIAGKIVVDPLRLYARALAGIYVQGLPHACLQGRNRSLVCR
jgi:aspartate/glutamate racemase